MVGLNPESIVEVPVGLNSLAPGAAVDVQLLSDNGDDIYYNDGVIAKELPANEFKKFRSDVVTVSAVVPTAASASVSGRVFDSTGSAVSRATIQITNLNNGMKYAGQTGSFGNFRIAELTAGADYLVEVRAKGHRFNSRFITINEDVVDLEFIAQ